jgi:pyruvate ferredoxin oxidoreductase gamma subunit
MEEVKLPENGREYYEIRLESIGGLGANLCGKMLGELGVKYLDLNGSSFSSYGSEKTGTPVKGYVRYARKEKEIRVHSPILNPDLLVVFHEALLRDESVWEGCGENTSVIIALDNGKETYEGAIPTPWKKGYGVKSWALWSLRTQAES